jgi:hypothetical protein
MRRARKSSSQSLAEWGLMVVRDVGVVGVECEADFRVVQLRQLLERDHAGPIEGAGRAVGGRQPVA